MEDNDTSEVLYADVGYGLEILTFTESMFDPRCHETNTSCHIAHGNVTEAMRQIRRFWTRGVELVWCCPCEFVQDRR